MKRRTLKSKWVLIVCVMLLMSITACGNSYRSAKKGIVDTTTTETAVETESVENTTDQTVEPETILAEIDQYKADFISGKWDGSPIFIGGNVLSVDEKASIWLNDEQIKEPLYCKSEENATYYPLDQDDTFMYYYKDVESETEAKYYILQVNKKTGDTVSVEVPEETYSAELVHGLENTIVRGKYALYRIDFRVAAPEAVLLNEVVSDCRINDYGSSFFELRYITGDRLEYTILFNKENGDELVDEGHETDEAHYPTDQGELTFYDNEIYSKARELIANMSWDGSFVDLYTLDQSIPKNTFAKKDYDGNIIINNKVEGVYYRAMQLKNGCNVSGEYEKKVWFEDGFNQLLHFYFPNQQEEYTYHSYGTDLPELRGYTRMFSFYYDSDLVEGKTAGCHVYLLSDGEVWYLDCNFVTEEVKSKTLHVEGHRIIDMNWAYDSLYYLLDNGEAYTIEYNDGEWDFENPKRFGGERLFYALSHHTDEREGALSYNEGNYYGDNHLYSPYGEYR